MEYRLAADGRGRQRTRISSTEAEGREDAGRRPPKAMSGGGRLSYNHDVSNFVTRKEEEHSTLQDGGLEDGESMIQGVAALFGKEHWAGTDFTFSGQASIWILVYFVMSFFCIIPGQIRGRHDFGLEPWYLVP